MKPKHFTAWMTYTNYRPAQSSRQATTAAIYCVDFASRKKATSGARHCDNVVSFISKPKPEARS